jgi:hypothetical protein
MITKEHLRLCVKIAYRMTRDCPWQFDEAESEAYLALGEAVRSWERWKKAVHPRKLDDRLFYGLAATVIRRKVFKLIYEFPLGYRSRESRKKGASRDGIPSVGKMEKESYFDLIPSESHPVGWEVEYQDEVMNFSREMTPAAKKAFRARHLYADSESPEGAAKRLKIKKRMVADGYYQALLHIRKSKSCPDDESGEETEGTPSTRQPSRKNSSHSMSGKG